MNTSTDDSAAPAADTLDDVAGTHLVTDAEREAMAPEVAEGAETVAPDNTAVDAEAAALAIAQAAAAPAEVAPQPSAVAPVASSGPTLLSVPEPPKDFSALFAALDARNESGELDDSEYNREFRAITQEEAAFIGQKSSIETYNAAELQKWQSVQAQSFDSASSAWVNSNKEFMANPLRANAFQQAINVVDQETKGALSPSELLEKASKIAFEAFNWSQTPAGSPAATADSAAQRAAALAKRQPNTTGVPATLGDAPSSGTDTGTSKFAALESLGVLDMEAQIARMSPADQDAFLREVDGPVS